MTNQQGQSMLEALGFFAVLALLLGSLWQHFHEQALRAQQRVEYSRSLLWQVATAEPDEALSTTSDYAAARALAPILQPLAQWTALDLPLHNVRLLQPSETTLAGARLHDDWSPAVALDLHQRPAQLVPLHHLQQLGLTQVLQVFSWLPVSREFAPTSLRFGWVNDEATPITAECERAPCS